MVRLEFPNEWHEAAYSELIEEWVLAEGSDSSPGALFAGKDFDEFLEITSENTQAEDPMVPSHLFFLLEDTASKILGAIDIRHHINHPNLGETWGHIGYGVRPSERQKGYATEMLRLGLIEAKKLWISKALLTCDDNNIGSRKVIEANGGEFERFSEKDGRKLRRYWIEI